MTTHFYFFTNVRAGSPFEADCEEVMITPRGPAPTCPACGRYVGMLTWEPPLVARIEAWGKHLPDVVFASGNDLLISEELHNLYMAHGFSGIATAEPVRIEKIVQRKRSVKLLPRNYLRATLVRTRTLINFSESSLVWEKAPTCAYCQNGNIESWDRIVMDASTWEGEDIFFAFCLSSQILVSQRFAEFCKAQSISGVRLMPTHTCQKPDYGLTDSVDAWECGAPAPKLKENDNRRCQIRKTPENKHHNPKC